METLPLIFAYVGMALMLGLSCTGSAIGCAMAGNTTIAAMKKNPDIYGKSLILCALPSTQGLYGFASFFLMLSSLRGLTAALTIGQGLALFASGAAVGLVGLYSAIQQASICANGIKEMSDGSDVFSKSMILAVFPELYAILTFAASFLALP